MFLGRDHLPPFVSIRAVSKKRRDQEARRVATARMNTQPWGPSTTPGSAEGLLDPDRRSALLSWSWPLVDEPRHVVAAPIGEKPFRATRDVQGSARLARGDVWHVWLGGGPFRSVDPTTRKLRDQCYGKGRNCLDDGRGHTTCIEVVVAHRL